MFDGHNWVPTGESNISWLFVSGVIMLSIYIMPIILRPIDFFSNMGKYLVGFFAYLFMIPTFVNVL